MSAAAGERRQASRSRTEPPTTGAAGGFSARFGPRDLESAARSGAAYAAAGSVLLLALTATVPSFNPTASSRAAVLTLSGALLVLAVVAFRAPQRVPGLVWTLLPTAVVVVATTLDLVTRDASAAGQVILTWPVLYAAQELRPAAAWATLVQVVAGDALIAFSLRPAGAAAGDLAWVSGTATIFCVLLVRAREQQQQLVSELRRQAASDPLTGLATRRVLDDATRSALRTGAGTGETALLLVDVDGFKAVNDRLGHPVGDDVLVHLASLLRVHFGGEALVARLGGDELAVLAPGWDTDRAVEVGEAFLRRLAEVPPRPGGTVLPVTVSIGVASTHLAREPSALYAAADQALYRAKREGRACVRGAGPTDDPSSTPEASGGRRPGR